MGAGFVFFTLISKEAQEISLKNHLKSWNAGVVEEGKKQVIIKLKIYFKQNLKG